MTDTRPGETALQERIIAAEVARILSKNSELEYRERLLTSSIRTEIGMESMQRAFELHEQRDNERFQALEQRVGNMTQTITKNSSWIDKGIGIASAFVVMIGVVMWIIDKFAAHGAK